MVYQGDIYYQCSCVSTVDFLCSAMFPSLYIGYTLKNRYLIKQVLGHGGFGRTYLASDQERFGEVCVVKEFTVSYSDEALIEQARKLFQREASILHQIQHPQIPLFRAAFEADDRLWLVQDFVEGSTYRHLLNQRKRSGQAFSEPEVLQLLGQLLPVLSYLHDRQIIHRDISPDNIILNPVPESSVQELLGTPILIDFGAVKEATSGLSLVSSMTRVGKVGYAPPEQLQTGNVQPYSDLYALAVTCLVLLTGREPQDLMDSQDLSWCWQPYTQISPILAEVLQKMLSLHPGDRYGSARDVWMALSPLLQAQPSTQLTWSNAMAEMTPVTIPSELLQSIPSKFGAPVVRVDGPASTAASHAQPSEPQSSRLACSSEPSLERRSSLSLKLAIAASLVMALGIGTWIFRTPTPIGSTQALQTRPSEIGSVSSRDLAVNSSGPQPIRFKKGEISAIMQGNLQDKNTQIYQLRAFKGQIMSVILDGSGVVMNLAQSNREPIDSSSSETRSWTGRLPSNDEYEIQITGSGRYTLDVSITPLTAATAKSKTDLTR